MHFCILIFLFFGISFFLTSCFCKPYQSLFQKRNVVPDGFSVQKTAMSMVVYLIKVFDILQIRNLQNAIYIVDGSPVSNALSDGIIGTVALPAINHVTVAGQTGSEAAKHIEALYRKSLLKDPIIELKIVNLKITLLGEIKSQGNYPQTKDSITLMEMIRTAGGLTNKTNETTIQIIRGNQANPQVTLINLRNTQSINDPCAMLQNGDTIYIVQNEGAVRNEHRQNISVISESVLLMWNLALNIFTLAHC
jgi:polysaccharide export outer membrane protein